MSKRQLTIDEIAILNGDFTISDVGISPQESEFLKEGARSKIIKVLRYPLKPGSEGADDSAYDLGARCDEWSCRCLAHSIYRRPGHFINWRTVTHKQLPSLRSLRELNDRIAKKIMGQYEKKYIHLAVDLLVEQQSIWLDDHDGLWRLDAKLATPPPPPRRRYKRDDRSYHGMHRGQSNRRMRPAGISTGTTARSSMSW